MTFRTEHLAEGVTLICGDCREVLPTLGQVDAVVADPPFGIGFEYESHNDTAGGYGEFIWGVIAECERRCQPDSPIFVWQSALNFKWFPEWFPRNWRVFCGAKNFVQMRPTAMQWSYDPILVWWTLGKKQWSAGTATRDFHIADTAPVVASPLNPEKEHPCPRPLDQVSHIVEQWCKPGGVVLDPFMGSGTTGVAAVRLGRKFVGIEIEPKYFDIACRRVSDALKQPDFFIERPKPKQEAMPI